MLSPLRLLTALTALFLALATVPASAYEGGATESDETTETAEDGGTRLNGKFLILFAEGFDATEEDLLAWTDLGLGFGDIFKLNLYATVLGMPVDDLVAGATFDAESGDWDFGWGDLRADLTAEQVDLLEGLPRNFGQLVSASARHQGRDEHRPDHAGRDGEKTDQGARPDRPRKADKTGR